jgi:hypothetical protein
MLIIITYQEEGEDDATNEEPLADTKRNDKAVLTGWTRLEDCVCPIACGQHCDGSEDIGNIDEE